MRFLVDECCGAGLVNELRSSGHDVAYVLESGPGARDADIMARAAVENRVVLTEDKDFGELAIRWRHAAPGVILLRLEGSESAKAARLLAVLSLAADRLVGHYTVVTPAKVRFRPLPHLLDSGV